MKLNKYIGLAAMAVAFTACQQDMLEGENMQNGIYTLSGNMAGGAAMSRAQVILGNTDGSKESFMWNDGDAFALYQNMESHVFTISSDYNEISSENKKAASFTTNNPASAARYVAIYPADVEVADDNSAKFELQDVINFTNADTQAKQNGVWRSYLMKNMFMMAKGTLVEGASNVVNFEHLCAMARITYTNTTEEAQSIGSIRLGGEQNITTSMSYYIPDEYQNGSGSTNWYTVNTTGLTVAAGATTDFYIMFFPSGFGSRLDITLNINSSLKTVSLDVADILAANTGAEGFEAGKRYWFKLTGYRELLIWSKDFTTDVVTIENPELSLAVKDALTEQGIDVELDNVTGYAKLSKMDALCVRNLSLGNGKYKVKTLDGIEHFENLNYLNCSYSGLEEADLSQNIELTTLEIDRTNLRELNLNNNINLWRLRCSNCQYLTTLNIDKCVNINELEFDYTPLQSLQISESSKSKMITLGYSGTVVPIDLNEFPNLFVLYCKDLNLPNLNHIPETLKNQLINISVDGNALESLDLSKFPSLGTLRCNNNKLTSLDLTPVPSLNFLECTGNMIKQLDIKPLTGLLDLHCGMQMDDNLLELIATDAQKGAWNATWKNGWGNENVYLKGEEILGETITIQNAELSTALQADLGASNMKLDDNGYAVMTKAFAESVETINIPSRQYTITSLSGIEHFINLKELSCPSTGLTECNLSKNTKLERVAVWGNSLTALDLSNQPSLIDINCAQNYTLQTLKINENAELNYLIIDDTNLQSLAIPHPETIWQLAYSRTPLNLDLTKFTGMQILFCSGNKLTAINLNPEQKSQLRNLECDSNGLTSLDLSEYSNLRDLSCWRNLIQTLDITPLTNLKSLRCGNQQNGIKLQLKLTDDQKTQWESKWKNENLNTNVDLLTGPSVESGNGNTGGNDFTIEGIY